MSVDSVVDWMSYLLLAFFIVVQAALEVKDVKIADELINNLLQVSYIGLNARLKKVCHIIQD